MDEAESRARVVRLRATSLMGAFESASGCGCRVAAAAAAGSSAVMLPATLA